MSKTKVVEPNNIHIKVWKILGDKGTEWVTKLFNKIIRSNKIIDECITL